MDSKLNLDFLKKFIPYGEFQILLRNLEGDEKNFFCEMLADLERRIRAMPKYGECDLLKPEDVKIGLHYFIGGSDFWVYALDQETLEAQAFVCLNGDFWNAETGPVFIPEIVSIKMMQLDLYWNKDTTLQEVMDQVNKS